MVETLETPDPVSPALPVKSARRVFWTQFGKAQISSSAASFVDFAILFLLVEVVGIYYTIAVAVGATAGAITNFWLNRNWSFEAHSGEQRAQMWRYAQVSVTSLGLNVAGTYALTELAHLKYGYSRLIASFVVGIVFNFPLQKRYVFK